jgi:hypothetical protein
LLVVSSDFLLAARICKPFRSNQTPFFVEPAKVIEFVLPYYNTTEGAGFSNKLSAA